MDEQQQRTQNRAKANEAVETAPRERRDWETPRMEDVSEQVMAQPYIRFT